MSIGGPRNRADVLTIIERRIVRHIEVRRECEARGERLDVNFLNGCISELEIIRSVVEAMQTDQ